MMGRTMNKPDDKFEVIKDHRSGILYLDWNGGMIRNFEERLGSFSTKAEALKVHPGAKDITHLSKEPK